MTPELVLLFTTVASVAFFHTVMGPDHYVPFIALGKNKSWSLQKTCWVVFACALGHAIGSILLGAVGIYFGLELQALISFEGNRGVLAAWAMIAFGLIYGSWGLKKSFLRRPHEHWHVHDGIFHSHQHVHDEKHRHIHNPTHLDKRDSSAWALFIIFVLGPCEPLIPLMMLPAVNESLIGVVGVIVIFFLVTLITMLGVVIIGFNGLNRARFDIISRYGSTLTGGSIAACGLLVIIFEI